MSLRLIKRLRYNLTSCEDLRFYKKAGNLREHHLLISIQPPVLEKVGIHPTSITFILGYCKHLSSLIRKAVRQPYHWNDNWWCPWWSVLWTLPGGKCGWWMSQAASSFIFHCPGNHRRPCTNLHSTSVKLQLGISFQERVQTGRAIPKEGAMEAKSNTYRISGNVFSSFCASHYNEPCYIWLPLWKTSPKPPMAITF